MDHKPLTGFEVQSSEMRGSQAVVGMGSGFPDVAKLNPKSETLWGFVLLQLVELRNCNVLQCAQTIPSKSIKCRGFKSGLYRVLVLRA